MIKTDVSLWGGHEQGICIRIRNLWVNYQYEVITCLLCAFFAYMFAFTNKIPNWDDTQYLFGKGATLSSGRWGLDILAKVLPNISMPWLWGWVSVLILTGAICVLLDLFRIKNRVLRCVLAGVIITFPSEAGTMLYMFTSTSYAIAFACAVLAAALYCRNELWLKILAVLLSVFSLSIYQAYISITASFFILLLIQQLICGDKAVAVIRKGIGYLSFLIISLAVYCLATFCALRVAGTELNGWAVRATTTSGGIVHQAVRAWKLFMAMIVYRDYGLVTSGYSWIAHIVCLACTALVLLQRGFKGKGLLEIMLMGVMGGILLPLSVNALVLLIGENGVHALTLYSFIAVYLLVGIVWECVGFNTLCRRVSILALIIILLSNVYAANKAYFRQYMVYENTFAFYTSVVTQIQMTPGFDEDCTIAIIGNIDQDSSYLSNFGDEPIYGLNGFKGYVISDEFITHYLGVDFAYADAEQIEAIRKSAEFSQMPSYPFYGYIQKIGDSIVVKIGE